MVLGDLRDPVGILRHPDVLSLLDLARPVAVLCTSTQTIRRSRVLCQDITAGQQTCPTLASSCAPHRGTLKAPGYQEGSHVTLCPVQRTAVRLGAYQCPTRGHRVKGSSAGRRM